MIFNGQVDTRIALIENEEVSFPINNSNNQDLEDKVGDYKFAANLNDLTDYVSIDEYETPPTSQEEASPTSIKEGPVLRDRSKIKLSIRYEACLKSWNHKLFTRQLLENTIKNGKRRSMRSWKFIESTIHGSCNHSPQDKSTIGYKWVFNFKESSAGDRPHFKARLCAKGST